MRLAKDRIRHTILYEVILLALLIPLSSVLLHMSPDKVGFMGLTLSLLAMVWNYFFNLAFINLYDQCAVLFIHEDSKCEHFMRCYSKAD